MRCAACILACAPVWADGRCAPAVRPAPLAPAAVSSQTPGRGGGAGLAGLSAAPPRNGPRARPAPCTARAHVRCSVRCGARRSGPRRSHKSAAKQKSSARVDNALRNADFAAGEKRRKPDEGRTSTPRCDGALATVRFSRTLRTRFVGGRPTGERAGHRQVAGGVPRCLPCDASSRAPALPRPRRPSLKLPR